MMTPPLGHGWRARVLALIVGMAAAGPSTSQPPTSRDTPIVSVMAEGEGGSAAYRIPGLLFFQTRLFAVGTARTLGCKDKDSGPHNLVLKTSGDAGG